MTDVVIDLETMGKTNEAAIIQIGAVIVDLSTGVLGEKFHCCISLESAMANGGAVDADTILWWMKQSDTARLALYASGPHQLSMEEGLCRFAAWLPAGSQLWGNGSTFDNVILASAYRSCGFQIPWDYHRGNPCYKTLRDRIAPEIPFIPYGVKHHALDDAIGEALHLVKIFQAQKNLGHLTPAEIQSGLTRVDWAEGLITQLPANHEGRNSWLMNHGKKSEAQSIRINHGFPQDEVPLRSIR